MATKQEITDHIAKKLEPSYEPVTGAYVRDAVVPNIDINTWNSIASRLNNRQLDQIGRLIGNMVKDQIEADAQAQAASMLVDDQLSLSEYAETEGLP